MATCEVCHEKTDDIWQIEIRNKGFPIYHTFCSEKCSLKWKPPVNSISYEELMD